MLFYHIKIFRKIKLSLWSWSQFLALNSLQKNFDIFTVQDNFFVLFVFIIVVKLMWLLEKALTREINFSV